MSRPSSRNFRPDRAQAIGAWLLTLLLIPRLMRMFYPEVWVEDDFYLEAAWMVSAGMRPYLDFVHVHFPVLEWMVGLYANLFGTSHLSLEFLNEAAIYATSLLAFALGRRVGGRTAGIASAILYGFASLVFRYHVYERECFVAPLIAGAAITAVDEAKAWSGRNLLGAGMLTLACAIKLTSIVPAIVIFGYLIWRRQLSRTVAAAALVVFSLSALTLVCYWLYGNEFLFQTFIFHFMKGRDTRMVVATYPALILDILAPLFALGVVRLLAGRPIKNVAALVLLITAAEYIFYGLLSPTAWGHNYLEVLPFIAIVAGIGLLALLSALRNLIVAEAAPRSDWIWTVGGGMLVLICLLLLTPLVNENWLHGSVYGFGFISRDEIAQIAETVKRSTSPADNIIAPSFICFEANRPELIRFPETYGVYREAKTEFERDGFFAARERLGGANFFDLIGETSHYWTDQLKDAVRNRKVKIVISDSPIQLLPLVLVQPQLLADNGYRPILRTAHYVVWHLEAPPTK